MYTSDSKPKLISKFSTKTLRVSVESASSPSALPLPTTALSDLRQTALSPPFNLILPLNMEANAAASHDYEDQDEYVLLDLDGVYDLIDIPPRANYVLTGLDTLNPVLIIDDKFKLIGEYEETIGTCLAFTEQDTPVVHEETGPSEVNLFSGTRLIDSNQHPTKQVKPVCQLHKVLKFKLSPDSEIQKAASEEAN